jgi:hypothetical protein
MVDSNKGTFRLLSRRPDITGGDEDNPVVDSFASIRRPKLKFNFTVTFKFRYPLSNELQNSMTTNGLTDEVTFAIKQASRPNPIVSYQDVNFYNYRTKVATKMDFGTVQLTFYDDVGNVAHNIFESYLKALSPIANLNENFADLLYNDKQGPRNKNFNTDGTENGASGSGSIGPLSHATSTAGGESGLIQTITLRHWFISQIERRGGEQEEVANLQYVDYHFLNPKIINMSLDELDMTQSDVNTLMLNFIYDSVFINSPGEENKELKVPLPEKNTFTLNDIRGKIADAERLLRRVKRIDTIPDIPVVSTISTFIPPITGNLDNIPFTKPDIDFLPDIIEF